MEEKRVIANDNVTQETFKPKVTVVVPTFNEAENLRHVLPAIPPVDEIILVDGHSHDDTVAIARELLPDIRVIYQTGRGKGNALREGFAAATGDIIVMIDADGSTDPREIPRFVDALRSGDAEFAKGSRFMQGGGSYDITPLRRLGNWMLCLLVNLLYWTNYTDLCYGYNAFWRHCLDVLDIDGNGFEIETQLTLRVHKAQFKVVEVPSYEYPRIHGESNLRTFRDGTRVLKTIMRELKKRAFRVPRLAHLFE
jgi:glycosyltransferase involved in cell wall biosynthesis